MPRIRSGAKFGGIYTAETYEPYYITRNILGLHNRVFSGNLVAKPFGDSLHVFRKIGEVSGHNLIPDAALDAWLDIMLHGTTQITTWYTGLFENNFTPDGDETYATPGFTECTAYDEAARPTYNEAAASSQSITNSANKSEFTMNDTKTLYGGFLVGGGTNPSGKGDTTSGGTLCCCAPFTAPQPVISGNLVYLTYTIGAADDGV